MNSNRPYRRRRHQRRGGVIVLMAIVLPVIVLFCGIALNIAYMQLRHTELQVATDAAARAGGRAFSEFQDVDRAVQYVVDVGQMNHIGNQPLRINPSKASGEIEFGLSTRANNGLGRYEFEPRDRDLVKSKTKKATSIRVHGKRTTGSLDGTIDMIFAGYGPFRQFAPELTSTATQVDRDIALVLDRSGSMLEYKNFPELRNEAYRLRSQNRITSRQRNDALTSIWRRQYPWWVYYRGHYYYAYFYYWHYDNAYNEDLWEYAYDYQQRRGGGGAPAYNTSAPAPRHSRWAQLEDAVTAFLNVLEQTDQEERVSLITFNSSARKTRSISSNYPAILNDVIGIAPKHGTNISHGMYVGAESIMDHENNPLARFYAAKTIIVLTDGEQTVGSTMPSAMAEQLVDQYNLVIHTITFSASVSEDSKEEMQAVARKGNGRYYHAEDGADLVPIFEEIANNLPTIITD